MRYLSKNLYRALALFTSSLYSGSNLGEGKGQPKYHVTFLCPFRKVISSLKLYWIRVSVTKCYMGEGGGSKIGQKSITYYLNGILYNRVFVITEVDLQVYRYIC